ncbi:AAA family ATPase [Demequina sp. SYSU T00039]|uniref:AAA family ATPase n=1 Tax=Demequina lignilytica TaxID=3051663 RepID=A0AAW7M8M2_9MICO|nr:MULTISPECIES: AAA family ATPase [unclassified Demequina]MDN4477124.1 AAA family ATPase [Demequina sp. SYSU T00039-1]MDN4487297.1 AAA family ATPase [Demequina sp. SYSU T00039]MDN4491548.1 AAA family ATPase [Demequina sp. SYSU T00068]
MEPTVPSESDLATVADLARSIRTELARVLSGLDRAVDAVLATVLAEGHVLLEDVPGVGKTTLARALGRACDVSVGRIQFTPDLLPSDVTGVSVLRGTDRAFEFRPGPVFANIVIADEINRASPKTQAALLESMQEHAVTVDGQTRPLPRPFLVVATQNPVDMEGTYPLPEAQRDRFMTRITVGYPSGDDEMEMLRTHDRVDPLDSVAVVADAGALAHAIEVVRSVYTSEPARRYVVDLVRATRESPELRLGASPRASLQLLALAKARAAMSGRDHVLPDDVKALAPAALAHRVILTAQARSAARTAEAVVTDLTASVPVPTAGRPVPAPR